MCPAALPRDVRVDGVQGLMQPRTAGGRDGGSLARHTVASSGDAPLSFSYIWLDQHFVHRFSQSLKRCLPSRSRLFSGPPRRASVEPVDKVHETDYHVIVKHKYYTYKPQI